MALANHMPLVIRVILYSVHAASRLEFVNSKLRGTYVRFLRTWGTGAGLDIPESRDSECDMMIGACEGGLE